MWGKLIGIRWLWIQEHRKDPQSRSKLPKICSSNRRRIISALVSVVTAFVISQPYVTTVGLLRTKATYPSNWRDYQCVYALHRLNEVLYHSCRHFLLRQSLIAQRNTTHVFPKQAISNYLLKKFLAIIPRVISSVVQYDCHWRLTHANTIYALNILVS